MNAGCQKYMLIGIKFVFGTHWAQRTGAINKHFKNGLVLCISLIFSPSFYCFLFFLHTGKVFKKGILIYRLEIEVYSRFHVKI